MNLSFYRLLAKLRPIELAWLVKKLARVKRQQVTIHGFKLLIDPGSNFGFRILRDGTYEPMLIEYLSNLLEEGDTFVDIGANEGIFSIHAGKLVGQAGKIFAVEPQIRLWPVILQNQISNRLSNITIIPYAVSETEAEFQMTLSPDVNTGSSTMVGSRRRAFWPKQTVTAIPIDQMMDWHQWKAVKLMKIDIEGFEWSALNSAKKLLQAGIVHTFLIEIHPPQLNLIGVTVDQINQLMASYGYQANPLDDYMIEYKK